MMGTPVIRDTLTLATEARAAMVETAKSAAVSPESAELGEFPLLHEVVCVPMKSATPMPLFNSGPDTPIEDKTDMMDRTGSLDRRF